MEPSQQRPATKALSITVTILAIVLCIIFLVLLILIFTRNLESVTVIMTVGGETQEELIYLGLAHIPHTFYISMITYGNPDSPFVATSSSAKWMLYDPNSSATNPYANDSIWNWIQQGRLNTLMLLRSNDPNWGFVPYESKHVGIGSATGYTAMANVVRHRKTNQAILLVACSIVSETNLTPTNDPVLLERIRELLVEIKSWTTIYTADTTWENLPLILGINTSKTPRLKELVDIVFPTSEFSSSGQVPFQGPPLTTSASFYRSLVISKSLYKKTGTIFDFTPNIMQGDSMSCTIHNRNNKTMFTQKYKDFADTGDKLLGDFVLPSPYNEDIVPWTNAPSWSNNPFYLNQLRYPTP